MEYKSFKDIKLSRLGFGAMRFPTVDGVDSAIDEGKSAEIVDYLYQNGVNYYDTAYSYHGGNSEYVLGRLLKKYNRESFYLASKLPGHEQNPSFDPKAVFEKQLEKTGAGYFDFYLLHNVYDNSIPVYTDERLRVVDFLTEQKEKGLIKHLGFSSHADYEGLRHFLDMFPDTFEFVQIQLNYLDWKLQNAGEKYALLTDRELPVMVMEPVRGGALSRLSAEAEAKLKALRPEESTASWAFRFLRILGNVQVVLSGMSTIEQAVDNVKTFSGGAALNETELRTLSEIADGMTDILPCTACRYCTKGCPRGLDIPKLLRLYNDSAFQISLVAGMAVEAFPEDKRPSACIGCGKCAAVCPQKINIPDVMKKFQQLLEKTPSWSAICAKRKEMNK